VTHHAETCWSKTIPPAVSLKGRSAVEDRCYRLCINDDGAESRVIMTNRYACDAPP
jgi:hypothetical protein